MKLIIAGIEYSGFLSARASLRIDAIADTFSFEATSRKGVPLPFIGDGKEKCVVTIDGQKVITGYIEVVNISGDAESHSIQVEGRDKTADLIDSSLGGDGPPKLSDFKAPISLATICRRILEHLRPDENSKILVIDSVNPPPFTEKVDLAAPEPGDNAFDFLEALARKRQVLLSSNADGDLVITRGEGVDGGGSIQNLIQSDSNNVLSYDSTRDSTGLFNAYLMASQLNAGGLFGSPSVAALVDQSAEVFDENVRAGRRFAFVMETSTSKDIGKERAKWERLVRRSRGKIYTATVDGYRNQAGALWLPNTLARVRDEYVNLDEDMLLNTVEFAFDLDDGRSTTLTFVEKDAYSLERAEVLDPDEGTTSNVFG